MSSFFNPKKALALVTGKYYCSECGRRMIFEDANEDTLVCTKCGHSVDLDMYGFDSPEDYESLYPTKEEVLEQEKAEKRARKKKK